MDRLLLAGLRADSAAPVVRSLRGIPSAYDRTNPQIPRRLRAEFPWRILCSLRADLALCGRLGCGLWQPLAATDCQGSYWSQRGPLARSSFLNRNSASQLHADLLAQLPGLGGRAFAKGYSKPFTEASGYVQVTKGGSIFSRDLKLAAVQAVDAYQQERKGQIQTAEIHK